MAQWATTEQQAAISAAIRTRHSERVPFDPQRSLAEAHLQAILEAARWAPTAHNMQNFKIIVVDDPGVLAALGRVHGGTSEEFIRENYAQLSFSEEELIRKGTGLLSTMFPPSWQEPNGTSEVETDVEHGFLDATMRSCPVVLIVVFDTRKRAPASPGDFLGVMSLGCVMQNMWLTATALGIGMQIMSVFSSAPVEEELCKILSIPSFMKIAFACRLGYPLRQPGRYLRVRRGIERFTCAENAKGGSGVKTS
jgi:nitroreductase